MLEIKCEGCCKERSGTKSQWWYLNDYYGLSGFVCNDCYNKVSHDAHGKPHHPVAYRNIKKKLGQI